MIKKATLRPQEIEYIEFKGYENFKELTDFVGPHIPGISLSVNRRGKEELESGWGTFEIGVIIYRYLDPDTMLYNYRVMDKEKFSLIYHCE